MCLTGVGITGCNTPGKPDMPNEARQIRISYIDTTPFLRAEGLPVIRGSINGVAGYFLLDTGATVPILTSTAARRCHFHAYWPSPSEKTNRLWKEDDTMMKATNITAEFAPGFTVHWPEVMVSSVEGFFGIVDYGTLKSAGAVFYIKNKTITLRNDR